MPYGITELNGLVKNKQNLHRAYIRWRLQQALPFRFDNIVRLHIRDKAWPSKSQTCQRLAERRTPQVSWRGFQVAALSAGAFVEARLSEEPGAGKPYAGICAGAVGRLAVLPRWQPR